MNLSAKKTIVSNTTNQQKERYLSKSKSVSSNKSLPAKENFC
jgi:hypothetical protein